MAKELPPLTPRQQLQWERIHTAEAKSQWKLGMSREELDFYFKDMAAKKTEETSPMLPLTIPTEDDNFNGWDQVAKSLFPKNKNKIGWFRG